MSQPKDTSDLVNQNDGVKSLLVDECFIFDSSGDLTIQNVNENENDGLVVTSLVHSGFKGGVGIPSADQKVDEKYCNDVDTLVPGDASGAVGILNVARNINQKNSKVVNATKRKYVKHNWMPHEVHSFHLTGEEWCNVFDNTLKRFRTATYANFFADKMNSLGISCVLVAQQQTSAISHSLIFRCKHYDCTRFYKLQSRGDYTFHVFYEGRIEHNVLYGLTRPLNGNKRIEEREIIKELTPKAYAKKKRKEANPVLLANGNLQGIKSVPALSHLKHEALSSNDFHQDHIIDLMEMKKDQKVNVVKKVEGAEQFIQWISADPFFVHAFSSRQIQVLKRFVARGEPITLYVDATGSIVARPDGVEKRVYYYVASLALPILEEERKLIFPLIEMVSAEHDGFTIGTWLGKFKSQYIKEGGKWPPFAHFVTDFSFAILNGASVHLNNRELIDYINELYYRIMNNLPVADLLIRIHICCNHFMKTTATDVDIYFPPSQSSTVVRSFLKETIALMFNLKVLEPLSKVYECLSVILNSKYISDKVTAALDYIASLAKTAKKVENSKDEDENENEEILTYDEPIDDPMYKTSMFYKMFEKLTFRGEYHRNADNNLNNFYSPDYCNLLHKKYMSILPLWTSLSNEKRFSNSYSETGFKLVKQDLTVEAPKIGAIPLRSSRFLRFTRNRINGIADDFFDQLPRYNTCNRKRKPKTSEDTTSPSPKRSRGNSNSSQIQTPHSATPTSHVTRLGIVASTPKTSKPPQSQFNTPQSATPTSRGRRLGSSRSQQSQFNTPQSATPTSRGRRQGSSSQSTPKVSERSLESQFQTPKCATSHSATPKRSRGRPSTSQIVSTPLQSICELDDETSIQHSYIGDPNAVESWQSRKSKPNQKKHSYFDSTVLKNYTSSKVSEKIFKTNDKRVLKVTKIKNHLIDDPNVYFYPKKQFVVARFKQKMLFNYDFKSLREHQNVTSGCIDFFLNIFSSKRKDIQFVMSNSAHLIGGNTSDEKLLQIKRDNIVAVIDQRDQYSVVIVNLKKILLSYINHKIKSPDVEIQYRTSLCHFALQNAEKMTNFCLICGDHQPKDEDTAKPEIDWIECERCYRWCHTYCIESTIFDTVFECLLCKV